MKLDDVELSSILTAINRSDIQIQDTRTTLMKRLEEVNSYTMSSFQDRIDQLRLSKGWNNEYPWLGFGITKELGELFSAYEHGLSEEEMGKEWADVEHFLMQFMRKVAPNLDLDKALMGKIIENSKTKKKTFEDGKIVKK